MFSNAIISIAINLLLRNGDMDSETYMWYLPDHPEDSKKWAIKFFF